MTNARVFDPFAPDAGQHLGGAFDDQAILEGPFGYAVLGYELAGAVLRDRRFQNSALRLMEQFGITDGPVHDFRARSIIMVEGEPQLRLRTPLARFMSPVTVKNTRAVLRTIVEAIADDLDDSAPIEFHNTVARRIPSMVYCHLAGAPMSDAPKVQSISERTLSLLSRDPSLTPTILEAYDELFAYLDDLIGRKREEGLGEDMLSYLIALGDEGKLTELEVLTEATSMLEASSVNTAHQAALVVWTLLRDRNVWKRLSSDPTLIPAAVVEALRLYPRTGVVSKIATEDVEVGGVVIPRGADVHVAVWSANRDPERFENPELFDLDRERNQPLTFSTGPHNCLGQGLAKAEIEEVVGFLVERYPNATVVEDGTRVGQAGGRWLVDTLLVDLKP
ncbi:cytochrome P450 [Streptomyces brasiliensis]|uniref:Cytochrome P450 n=1 Tax=Streptomyces brasiliensis TaxID=1954 RepID=A0A917UL52_9ACTN|nr:cytochrome P450 [Streptomyces brasiliensis]GGJ65692.1 cytochrome P450 [Streptomyces brasiliensis]